MPAGPWPLEWLLKVSRVYLCHQEPMKQRITGFHTDPEGHWVADLECGHRQHMRHAPPWTVRPWVLTEEGRRSRLGVELECKRCDEAGLAVAEAVREALRTAAQQAYEDGGLSGLCAEGRWELALDALGATDLRPVIRDALAPRPPPGADGPPE